MSRIFQNEEASVITVWLQGERLGDHVHVLVRTGEMFGQANCPTYNHDRGESQDPGIAKEEWIIRAEHWLPFVKALAVGGYATGLRVIWRCPPDELRYLWNGAADAPCIVGTTDPVPWTMEVPE
jgi:hypothetical protein